MVMIGGGEEDETAGRASNVAGTRSVSTLEYPLVQIKGYRRIWTQVNQSYRRIAWPIVINLH